MDLSIFDYKPLTPDQTERVARVNEALKLAEVAVMALPSATDEEFYRVVSVLFKALARVILENAPDGDTRRGALGQVVHAHMLCLQVRTGYPEELVSSSFTSTSSVLGGLGSAGMWARRAIALDGHKTPDQEGLDE